MTVAVNGRFRDVRGTSEDTIVRADRRICADGVFDVTMPVDKGLPDIKVF